MGDRSAVLARVRQSAVQGERYAAAFEALGEKKRETAYPILLAYIRDRFLLTPELCRRPPVDSFLFFLYYTIVPPAISTSIPQNLKIFLSC